VTLFDAILYTGVSVGAVAIIQAVPIATKAFRKIPVGVRGVACAWLVLLAGLGLWLGRGAAPSTIAEVDSSAVLQITSIIFASFVVFHRIISGSGFSGLRSSLVFFGLYSLLGVATAVYSVAPALSIFKAGSLLIVVLLASISIGPLRRKRAGALLLSVTYYYLGFLVYLALVGGVLVPEITHYPSDGVFEMMLRGWPLLNSNTLSAISAIVVIVGFRRAFEQGSASQSLFHCGMAVVGLCAIILAQGRTSLAGLGLGLMFLSFTVSSMRPMRYKIAVSCVLVPVLLIGLGEAESTTQSIMEYLSRGLDSDSIRSLTGRVTHWRDAWSWIVKSPVLGQGFYTSDKVGVPVHNAYLMVLMCSGLLGFLAWCPGILMTVWNTLRGIHNAGFRFKGEQERFTAEAYAVMSVLALRTITGSSLTSHGYSTMLFFAFVVYEESQRGHALPEESRSS
jgi:O-antigen ligase